MNSHKGSNLSCRFCQNYEVEGRRGGLCHLLNVSVRGNWQACPLAMPSFVADKLALTPLKQHSDLPREPEKIIPLKTYLFSEQQLPQKVS